MSRLNASPVPEGVAVIGMAGRFPGANDVAQFWRNLCAGKESIVLFSDQELAAAGVSHALLSDPCYVKAAARLEDADWFDAAFFGYSPKEATVMDPQHRVFLECAWEALEEAGYASDKYDGSIGVFAGAAMNSYLSAYARRLGSLEGDVLATFLGNAVDFLSTRVSYKLNLRGPSLNIQTACSTSLVATHLACQSLLHGECDMALAGGVSIKVTSTPGYFYQPGGIASPDGHCRAFDARAQGTLFGDGVGVVVLKRAADAAADGDHIYAVIRGSAINNDGASKVGYTAPSVNGQAEVIAEALAMAGIEPKTVGYVEAHGTGTALGDPIEIAALSQAFRKGTSRNGFCAISSVKTNIGHLDAAAGIAGLIKSILVLNRRMLPPSLHYEQPNPEIDFANSPFFVNTKLQEWKSGPTPRRAGVSSFGMGGTNAHMLVEEPPPLDLVATEADLPFQVLTLSAKTESALHALAARYGRYFDVHPDVVLSDASFTAQIGRVHFPHRLAALAASPKQAREILANFVAGREPEGAFHGSVATGSAPAIAFLFSGDESAYAGMGRELYATSPVFRAAFDECGSPLRSDAPVSDGGPELFATQYALAALWESWGIKPSVVMGRGIGEYAAACVAGVIGREETLGLLKSPAANGMVPRERALQSSGTIRIATRMEELRMSGANVFLEMGPPSAAFAPKDMGICLASMRRGRSAWEQMLSTFAELYVIGCEMDWAGFHRPYARRRVSLPTYPFERRRYWMEDVERRPAPAYTIAEPDLAASGTADSPPKVSAVRKEIEDAAPAERLDLMIAHIQGELVGVLGLDPSSPVDTRQGFFDMGMESLAALELKSRLQLGLGCTLPSTFAMNYPTVEALAWFIAGQVLGLEIPASRDVGGANEEAPLLAELDSLTEDDLAAMLDSELEQILGRNGKDEVLR